MGDVSSCDTACRGGGRQAWQPPAWQWDSLIGGRLLPGESGPAAQFMYQSTAGARRTMYVAAVPKDATAFRPFRDGNRSTFYWGSQGMGCALTGQGSEAQLRSMAIDVCSAQWGPLRSLALGDGLNP
ncbi:hypothetical protein P3T23_002608 [Paraburkholderia sp. GAS448]|uniref:anti-sigma factor family protein n=1 Tax=Paraburkholderia sp. GAS448 TaxID=3035136 RepID=UPI003D1AA46B